MPKIPTGPEHSRACRHRPTVPRRSTVALAALMGPLAVHAALAVGAPASTGSATVGVTSVTADPQGHLSVPVECASTGPSCSGTLRLSFHTTRLAPQATFTAAAPGATVAVPVTLNTVGLGVVTRGGHAGRQVTATVNGTDQPLTIHAAPSPIVTLEGGAQVAYDSVGHTVNKFVLDFTCDGKDTDVVQKNLEVTLGAVKKVLATPDANGRFQVARTAQVQRYSEGGALFPVGPGKVSITGTVKSTASRVTMTGTARVSAKRCTPPTIHFKVSGKLPRLS